MQASWRLGTLFGIPLLVHPSWLFILVLVTVANWGDLQSSYPPPIAWAAALTSALALFGSVVLHELGHSLVALRQGIRVLSITLFIFGGVATIDRESDTPGKALRLALAGPAVSFGLFVLFFLLAAPLASKSLLQVLLVSLAQVNLILALFNLLPGMPLDGGQALKALVWQFTGSRTQGNTWAARAGQFLGWVAVAAGLWIGLTESLVAGLWLTLIGWFALRNATFYKRVSDIQEALAQLVAAQALNRDFRVLDADLTLHQFAEEYLLEEGCTPVYFAASQGRYRGLVKVDDLRQVERSQWDRLTLHSLVHPLASLPSVSEKTPLAAVVTLLETQNLPWITVLTPAGAVAGLIDRGDIVQALGEKLRLAIPRGEIQRIKTAGVFPPGLPLGKLVLKGIDDSLKDR